MEILTMTAVTLVLMLIPLVLLPTLIVLGKKKQGAQGKINKTAQATMPAEPESITCPICGMVVEDAATCPRCGALLK